MATTDIVTIIGILFLVTLNIFLTVYLYWSEKEKDVLKKKIERLEKGNETNIPKPLYSIGERVFDFWHNKEFTIENMSYSVGMAHWYYFDGERAKNANHREDNLKKCELNNNKPILNKKRGINGCK